MVDVRESGPQDDRFPDPRYYGLVTAQVVNNEDARGLGRVRVTVPGLIAAPGSAWALPMGNLGGGSAQRGQFFVPKVGATVYVWFLDGDVDKPVYLPGHYGIPGGVSQAPTDVVDAFNEPLEDGGGPSAPPQVITLVETEFFSVTFDEREGKKRLILYFKSKGQVADGSGLMFEFDAEQGTWAISAPSALILRSIGLIDIRSLVLQLNERKVLPILGRHI
jgi:hypothetical protein